MKYPKLYKAFNKYIDLPDDAYLDIEARIIQKKIEKKIFYLVKVKLLITCRLLTME